MNMKKTLLSGIAAFSLTLGLTSCGEKFLETDYYNGVDVDGALTSANLIGTALNGTYYNLFERYFAGNYAVSIGDVPTDISYWNSQTGHWDGIYQYTFNTTDLYLSYIWEYGYKVVDNSARVILACENIYASASESDKTMLDIYEAEAYALRAYANLVLVNVYGHQVKVNGTDHSSKTGIVLSETPIPAMAQVSRSTVGEAYAMILSDLGKAVQHFQAAGGDREDKCYFTLAAVYGLMARANLYLENWTNAAQYAQMALDEGGIDALAYSAAEYKSLYNGGASNKESLFYLDINSNQNWSANSCGTLWTTYNFSPSPYLQSLYAATDARISIMAMGQSSTAASPVYAGGKFSHFSSGNTAYATNYLVNAPEMFLIIAEANIKQGNESAAKSALLAVAKRNSAITTVNDLPSGDDLYQFLKEERARELFQEGLRLYDLRRWGQGANIVAYGAPEAKYRFTNFNISDFVFPIPADEINAGYGVTQTENWAAALPK